MATPRRSQRRPIGIGLLLALLAFIALIIARQRLVVPQTGQADPVVIDQVAQLPTGDSPLPTVIFIGTIWPTPTTIPTVPPPPTPTIIPGPAVTPLPLPLPAPDASGFILYPASKSTMGPGQDTVSALYSVAVDKVGQPLGLPLQVGSDMNGSGFFAVHPSPDGSRIIMTDGWAAQYVVYSQSGKVEHPYHDNRNPRGQFFD